MQNNNSRLLDRINVWKNIWSCFSPIQAALTYCSDLEFWSPGLYIVVCIFYLLAYYYTYFVVIGIGIVDCVMLLQFWNGLHFGTVLSLSVRFITTFSLPSATVSDVITFLLQNPSAPSALSYNKDLYNQSNLSALFLSPVMKTLILIKRMLIVTIINKSWPRKWTSNKTDWLPVH